MDTPHDAALRHRLDRLEQRNRRLWRAVLLLVAGGVGLAAAGPGWRAGAAPALRDEVVTARALKVTDDRGNVRAEVAATPGGAEVVLYDDAGKPRVTLASNVQGTGPALSLRGADGKYWVLMGGGEPAAKGNVDESEPFLVVQDRQGVPIGQMRKPDPDPAGPKKR